MTIKTSDITSIKKFVSELYVPPAGSHKGNNGKVLIVGGSSLFHSASLWAAEIASHFVDMVHYSSTKENNAIFHELKTVFRNGIVVEHKDIPAYVTEDDAILIGPGMVREQITADVLHINNFDEIVKIDNEAQFTRQLTYYVLHNFPQKKFVLDAGALQMMDASWLTQLQTKPIITPHQLEFERLFGISLLDKSVEEKKEIVLTTAQKYNCVILLKAVIDIASDGKDVYVIEGGNAGLTKGGSGDILAGLAVSLFSKSNALSSVILASFIEKRAADELSKTVGTVYNMADLIKAIPAQFVQLLRSTS